MCCTDEDEVPTTEDDWLKCLEIGEEYKACPAGHLCPVGSAEIWIDGNGARFTREAYMKVHGCDPEVAWKAVKAYRASCGKKDVVRRL